MHPILQLRVSLATTLAPLLMASSLTAQRGGPVRTSALPERPTAAAPIFTQGFGPTDRGHSTFLERAAWGAGAGFLGVAAASALVHDEDGAWVAVPIIGAASAAGVMLVTAKREGARPLSTLLGTAIAMTIPGLVLANIDRTAEGPGPEVFVGFALLLSAPLGAAAGHGLGVR